MDRSRARNLRTPAAPPDGTNASHGTTGPVRAFRRSGTAGAAKDRRGGATPHPSTPAAEAGARPRPHDQVVALVSDNRLVVCILVALEGDEGVRIAAQWCPS